MAPEGKTEHEKRQLVFQIAEPIFIRFGYRKTTIEEVCRAARISKRTFYELFNDKFDLLMQMHANLAVELTNQVRAIISPDDSAAAKIRTYLDLFFEVTEERPLFRVLIEEGNLIQQMTEIAPTDEDFSSVIVLLGEIIQQGIASGEFRPMNAETTTWVIQSMLDTVHMFVLGSTAASQMLDVNQFLAETKDFIINGLLANRS